MDKFCCRCKRTLDTSLFNKRTRSNDGFDTYCRECASAYVKDWKAKRPTAGGEYASGKTRMGDLLVKDFAGQKFGSFTAISPAGKRNGKVFWNCICDCGGEVVLSTSHLRSKSTKNGCKCRTVKWLPQQRYSNAHVVISRYITGAKVRRLDWRLSPEEALSLLKGDCFYCGSKPGLVMAEAKGDEFVYNGIDRLDSAQGYLPDNCVSCCTRCNYMKFNMNVEDFVSKISQIYRHLQLKKQVV